MIILQSLAFLFYLLRVQPFDTMNGTYFEVFNEYIVLLVSTGVMSCLDNTVSDFVRYQIGWVLIGLCLLNFLANMINMLVKRCFKGLERNVKSLEKPRWRTRLMKILRKDRINLKVNNKKRKTRRLMKK